MSLVQAAEGAISEYLAHIDSKLKKLRETGEVTIEETRPPATAEILTQMDGCAKFDECLGRFIKVILGTSELVLVMLPGALANMFALGVVAARAERQGDELEKMLGEVG